MIISRAPFRISFFGGGTDFPDWYKDNETLIISTSIDKYCNIIGRKYPKFFEYENRISWSKIEEVTDIRKIEHPTIKAYLNYLKKSGFEFIHTGDLPARSGLGSSSAFSAALINLISNIENIKLNKKKLALESINLERNIMNEAGGIQDQIACAHGGFNKIILNKSNDYKLEPVKIDKEACDNFQSSLMLFFTGITRNSFEISVKHQNNLAQKEKELKEITDISKVALNIFENNYDLEELGNLINLSWQAKRSISTGVTTNELDNIYNLAKSGGALGGKLLGAGGGGFFLFIVPENKQEIVRELLSNLVEVNFKFENIGAKLINV
jgi:D-glycero-alpha-D-manno-heptose-7-phosphate kinase